jgi:hypothetical protein
MAGSISGRGSVNVSIAAVRPEAPKLQMMIVAWPRFERAPFAPDPVCKTSTPVQILAAPPIKKTDSLGPAF